MRHLVLGPTGCFGGAVVRELLARGEQVRVLARRPLALPGAEVVLGDALKMADMLEAVKGCDVVYQGLSAPMGRWVQELAPMVDNATEAAGLGGATLVLLQSLHGLRTLYGVPLPPAAVHLQDNERATPSARVRLDMEAQLLQNVELRGVRGVVIRACDLVGPGQLSGFGAQTVVAVRAGRPAPWHTDARVGHTFTSVADAAWLAVELARGEPAYVVVNAPSLYVEDAATWGRLLTAAAGRPVSVRATSRLALQLRAPIDRQARAFLQEIGTWNGPIELDTTRTERMLPSFRARTIEQALEGMFG